MTLIVIGNDMNINIIFKMIALHHQVGQLLTSFLYTKTVQMLVSRLQTTHLSIFPGTCLIGIEK